jgi:hypothetical protein
MHGQTWSGSQQSYLDQPTVLPVGRVPAPAPVIGCGPARREPKAAIEGDEIDRLQRPAAIGQFDRDVGLAHNGHVAPPAITDDTPEAGCGRVPGDRCGHPAGSAQRVCDLMASRISVRSLSSVVGAGGAAGAAASCRRRRLTPLTTRNSTKATIVNFTTALMNSP